MCRSAPGVLQSVYPDSRYDPMRPWQAQAIERTMPDMTQHFWRDATLPFFELRSTYTSVQAYKPHFHSQLSFGAVISGETRANCMGREHLLRQGDLILIPPHVVHSCNLIAGRPRSYHMLYLDEAWYHENVSPLACGDVNVIRD